MYLCLFESEPHSFLPLSHCQPVFDLRCGIFTARERSQRIFPDFEKAYMVRDHLAAVVSERTGGPVNRSADLPVTFLRANAILSEAAALLIRNAAPDTLFVSENVVVGAHIATEQKHQKFLDVLINEDFSYVMKDFNILEVSCALPRFPWDLLAMNREAIIRDAAFFALGVPADNLRFPGVTFVQSEGIFLGNNVRLAPGVVLDATEGPIIIDDDAELLPHATVLGPAYVGKRSLIRIGAKIYQGTTIGPVCKIGGEVEDSIFHSYANKQHDGFVGHSYLAPWTNLGADTNTSDLKNNYSKIRVIVEGVEHHSGKMFLGTIMADHSKCGINTMFNTGTTVGVGCNIYGGGFPPKYIPSFSWGDADGLVEYDFEKFAAVAKTVMERRDMRFTSAEYELHANVFKATCWQRSANNDEHFQSVNEYGA